MSAAGVWLGLCAPLLAALLALFPGWRRQRALSGALWGVAALAMIATGLAGMAGSLTQTALPVGLPWMPVQLALDPLGGFFLLLLGLSFLGVTLYAHGYLRQAPEPGVAVALPVFVTGMAGVLTAADAYGFMIFWEVMSLASYFLVVTHHEKDADRRAGFVYLLMAHLAGLFILGAFAVLYGVGGHLDFAAMRAAQVPAWAASAAFLLAALGFGLKAGVMPLHVWLPLAHPVAPSPASALMSGVMIKVAVFGFLRVVFDLLGTAAAQWWWGALVLTVGSLTAVGGVLMALQQHDLKRLLAYHSVENIGIIVIGVGLALVFAHAGLAAFAALALAAALFHTLNHALFKGLLFMGAGAVLQATGTREMETLGGLVRVMPYTAALFLVGCLSIAALPPFNGFVSEWLTFQAALLAPRLEGNVLAALLPLSAALLALAGALSAACFVKVFGVVFLGQARSDAAREAREADGWMQAGMALPALLCVLLGLFPGPLLAALDGVVAPLLGGGLPAGSEGDWLWVVPMAPERAGYSPFWVTLSLAFFGLGGWWLWGRRALRRAPLWSCGHPRVTPAMQYTATAFAQPLRRIFAALYRHDVHLSLRRVAGGQVLGVQYRLHVSDRIWQSVFLPLGRGFDALARWVEALHQRSVHFYLGLVMGTLVVLLAWVTL